MEYLFPNPSGNYVETITSETAVPNPKRMPTISTLSIEESYQKDMMNGDTYSRTRWGVSYAAVLLSYQLSALKIVGAVSKLAQHHK
ncbi:hypothetical protein [Bacillus subtilis]|uniref:hypothetical protein n=1 Tax=Bacillus subtilis TaxID=1423 RepID=UPI00292E192B|nr:hypothetical protein [Bacillus subtilis]WOA23156.1 hypothetical protein RW107_03985 [Bacillus subtilis]